VFQPRDGAGAESRTDANPGRERCDRAARGGHIDRTARLLRIPLPATGRRPAWPNWRRVGS